MPRKREELTPKHRRLLLDLMSRGLVHTECTAELRAAGCKLSQATIGRRIGELQGALNMKRAPKPIPDPLIAKSPQKAAKSKPTKGAKAPPTTPPPMPTEPTEAELDVLDDEIIEQEIARWRAHSDRAEMGGDYRALETAALRLALYLEQKRKRRRAEKVDPNDDPDLKARASTVLARLHDYVTKTEKLGAIIVEIPT